MNKNKNTSKGNSRVKRKRIGAIPIRKPKSTTIRKAPQKRSSTPKVYPFIKSSVVTVISDGHGGQLTWRDEKHDFTIGIDIGEKNYGITIIDIHTERVLEYILVNLRCFEDPTRNKKLSIKEMVRSLETLMKSVEMKHLICRDDCQSCLSKGPATIIIEEQMPSFASKGGVAYSNFIIQAVTLALLGTERCCVLGAEQAKKLFADDFPILASTNNSSKRNKFNKKNAMDLESKILNADEKRAIDQFDWDRHHHLIDGQLQGLWAIKEYADFLLRKKNGITISLPDDSDSDEEEEEEIIPLSQSLKKDCIVIVDDDE